MALNNKQISSLLKLVASVDSDNLDCDGCCQRIPEFIEAEAQPWAMTEVIESVRIHLENCSCCADEYHAVLEAMREIDKTCV